MPGLYLMLLQAAYISTNTASLAMNENSFLGFYCRQNENGRVKCVSRSNKGGSAALPPAGSGFPLAPACPTFPAG